MKGKKGPSPEDQPDLPPVPSESTTFTASTVTQEPQFVGIHAEFMADTTPLICLEGARYSGKTWAACAKVVKSCLDFPGIEWLISRYANEETEKKLMPEFRKMCYRYGQSPEWNAKENAFIFPNTSRVEASGLRSSDKLGHLAKVRGLDKGGILNDQSEELPQDIGEELPFGARQSGYPHQVLYLPNPPPEEHWMSDFFPDDNSIVGRKYYRVSLYDNPHCPEEKLAELERLYPPTHPRYKTLVLGLRGPASVGTPVYESAFVDTLHVAPLTYNPEIPLLEAIQVGQHHPVWLAAQRNYFGGIEILGGIMGKRLFLEDFLPIIQTHRELWFQQTKAAQLFCDPPPNLANSMRFTNIKLLRDAGFTPKWSDNATSPDVREATIQSIVGYMHRRLGKNQGFLINTDPRRWLMASHAVIKQSKFFADGCLSTYVWDDHKVSVGNKLYRQPKETEWVEGAQRCLENLVLNCWARKRSQAEQDEAAAEKQKREAKARSERTTPHGWLGT